MKILEKLVICLVMVLTKPFDWLLAVAARLRRYYFAYRKPPRMSIGHCDPLSENPGEHNIQFTSRHDIAECGLKCPRCEELVARRGDFKRVRRTRLGEAVECPQCGQILIASPDTEHGDDLLDYDAEVFHKFVRIAPDEALRQEVGDDVGGDRQQMTANEKRFSVEGIIGNVHPQQVPENRLDVPERDTFKDDPDEIDPTFHMLPQREQE